MSNTVRILPGSLTLPQILHTGDRKIDQYIRGLSDALIAEHQRLANRIEGLNEFGATKFAQEFGVHPSNSASENDTAIAGLLDALENGDIVRFPPGEISISSKIIVGNATTTTKSTYNNVTFMGSGSAKSARLMYTAGAATAFKWEGTTGGTMMEINGPIMGVQLIGLGFDCNDGEAATAIESIRSFSELFSNLMIWGWDDGFAWEINANRNYTAGGLGGAGAPSDGYYEHIQMVDPYGTSGAHCLRVAHAQTFLGNVNEMRFMGCTFQRGDHDDAIGIDLGYCDHLYFWGCWGFKKTYTGGSGIGLQLTCQDATKTNMPGNCMFVSSHIGGGVKNNTTYASWVGPNRPAAIFYPWYTSDGLINYMPPNAANGGTALPDTMVIGFTDRGYPLYDRAGRIIIASSSAIADTVVSTAFDKTLTLNGADVYRDGLVIRLRAGGRYSTTGTPTLRFYLYMDTILLMSTRATVCSNNASNYAWYVEGGFCTRPSNLAARLPGFGGIATFSPTAAPMNISTTAGTFGYARYSETMSVKAEWGTADASNSVVMDYFHLDFDYPLPER